MSLSLPFFERLTPVAFGPSATHFVRAALPPRFAAAQDFDPGESAADIGAAPDAADGGSPEPLIDRGSEQQNALPAIVIQKEALVVEATLPSRKEKVTAPDSAAPSPVRPAARAEANSAKAAVPARVVGDQNRSSSSARRGIGRTADRSVTRKAPLSAAAQAQRVAASNAAPTVVQVTIDRIDVRAPAPPAPPERAPRKRSGSAQSLSDYLRQREPSSGTAGE